MGAIAFATKKFVIVPDLYNMTQANAETAITTAGLTVGTVNDDYHATIIAGNVYDQSPAAGLSVPSSTSVNLDVSLGVEEFEETIDSLEDADDGDYAYYGNYVSHNAFARIGHDIPGNLHCYYPTFTQGSTIISCDWSCVTDTAGWGSMADIYIRFMNEDNPAQPIPASAPSKAVQQAYANTAAITWPIPNPTVNGTNRTTPELKTILQTIADRPSWSPGNRLILYLGGPAADLYSNEFNGQGGVHIRSYNYGGASRPDLYIKWSP